MSRPSRALVEEGGPAPERRRYDSPVRRQRVAETRTRILEAGSALVHGFPSWDWQGLTFRAVAERSGVSERTVYRHFATEQELHRAVMRQLEEEAGVTYEGLQLEDLGEVSARVLAARLSFAVSEFVPPPPFVEEDRRRHEALMAAVVPLTGDWSDTDRAMAAGVLDVIWAIPSYERLLSSWELTPRDATQAVNWVIALVLEAIQDGRRPGQTRTPRSNGSGPKRSPIKSETAKRKGKE